MHIFGPTKRKQSSQTLSSSYNGRPVSDRSKPFASAISSVKSLFSKRTQSKSSPSLAMHKVSTPIAYVDTSKTDKISKRHSAMVGTNSLRHKFSTCSLKTEEVTVQELSERYSQARARVLAETARRLQSTRSPSPVTPSSIDTGKTLPCFPEEDEYKVGDYPAEPAGESRNHARASVPSFATIGDMASSASSLTCTATPSRPMSLIEPQSGSYSPTAKKYLQNLPNASYETLSAHSSEHPSSLPGNAKNRPSCATRIKKMASWEPKKQSTGQRYSVAMSQNVSRRFQTRITHEYEQRIYCLHAHYTDVIERMEKRACNDMDRLQALQKEVDELRHANAALKIREAELQCQNTASVPALGEPCATENTPSYKQLAEFVEHYQDKVGRLTQEVATAQEWIITLAEMAVGPKQEYQSWEEWLSSCLTLLHSLRKLQKEKAW
ncbi:hypothetical protein H4R22_001076 [Coemansia sp. RSA 1290]|nr:hypothetical protein H4R22_001076 [Coemansia sp. RSA 1290]KAJ2671637.1 hypothetical protein IWW42_003248 [Coemansia sp. RSA 1085]